MDTDEKEQTHREEHCNTVDQEEAMHLHGDFPFQIVHLYHVQLDIYSESSRSEQILGIPWATFAVDARSWRLLAVYIASDLPRSASYLMILRECVRRYARLPQTLVLNEESGFNDRGFEAFILLYGITKVEHPLTEPDKASPLELLFGMTEIDFIEDVMNSTQTSESLGETMKANTPDPGARWSLDVFSKRLCHWCYEVYDTRLHPVLGQTPREAYEAGMLSIGVRSLRMIPYDETVRMMTLPICKIARVNPSKGVKALGGFYWTEAFRAPELEKALVPVRYDPADMSHVIVFAKGRWLQCKRVRWIPVLD